MTWHTGNSKDIRQTKIKILLTDIFHPVNPVISAAYLYTDHTGAGIHICTQSELSSNMFCTLCPDIFHLRFMRRDIIHVKCFAGMLYSFRTPTKKNGRGKFKFTVFTLGKYCNVGGVMGGWYGKCGLNERRRARRLFG